MQAESVQRKNENKDQHNIFPHHKSDKRKKSHITNN